MVNINTIETTLDNFRGKDINIWIHSTITTPVEILEDFQWTINDNGEDEYLILYSGETQYLILIDEILCTTEDIGMGELVIYMQNEIVIQLWCDIE